MCPAQNTECKQWLHCCCWGMRRLLILISGICIQFRPIAWPVDQCHTFIFVFFSFFFSWNQSAKTCERASGASFESPDVELKNMTGMVWSYRLTPAHHLLALLLLPPFSSWACVQNRNVRGLLSDWSLLYPHTGELEQGEQVPFLVHEVHIRQN